MLSKFLERSIFMLPKEALTFDQYQIVYNVISFAFAAMLASFVFFVLARTQVAEKYRGALIMSSLVVVVAGYHYFRIFESWSTAYTLQNGSYIVSGTPFNDAYRYVDWLLTVPLLLAELVAVLRLQDNKNKYLMAQLTVAAALMIGLGYPGEIAGDNTTRLIWGTLSTIPFVYIVYVLWVQLAGSLERQPASVKVLIRNIRLLLLATWGFYPIAYLIPVIGLSSGTATVALQVGYSIADVAAKCGYGLMIYAIARRKTEADAQGVDAKGRSIISNEVVAPVV